MHEVSADVLGGHVFDAGGVAVEPFGGLSFTWASLGAYAETGAPSEPRTAEAGVLIFENEHAWSLRSVLGVTLSPGFPIGDIWIIPSLSVDWRHEFLDDRRIVSARSPGFGENLIFSTDSPDRNWFELSGSVTADIGGQVQLFVAVNHLLGHRFLDRTAVLGGVNVPIR